MRSQALPLALCLFVSIVLLSLPQKALAKDYKKPLKHRNTDASMALETEVDDPSIFDCNALYLVESFANQDSKVKNKLGAQNAEAFSFKENSYKKRRLIHTLENSTQNYALHEAGFHQTSFFRGMFYGFSLMIIALNIVCFFLFEEKCFLYFGIAAIALATLFFISDGIMEVLFGSMLEFNSVFEGCALMIAALTFVIFSTRYLRLNQSFPKLKTIAIVLLLGASMFLMAAVTMQKPALVAVANLISVSTISFYLVMGILLFSKNNYAKFYTIASAIPALFLVDYFVLQPMGITFLGTETVHLKVATFIQFLVISYGIMYRMKAIKEEKELRKTEMRIFIKRQQIMNRKNVEKLMADVYLENLIMHYDLDGLEIKLLQYISEGKENVKIARKLKMTEKEVDELTQELYHKLEISEQIQEDFNLVESQPDYLYN